MKICILGLGYIGLPTAAMIAADGYDVVGVDTNRQRVEALQSGGLKFDEPGLAELVSAAFLSGKLRTACEVEAADDTVILPQFMNHISRQHSFRAISKSHLVRHASQLPKSCFDRCSRSNRTRRFENDQSIVWCIFRDLNRCSMNEG